MRCTATPAPRAVPGYVPGYDQESGFGLVQALQPLPAPPMELGTSAGCHVGDPVVIAGHGGADKLVTGRIIAKREFADYREYALDEALFTAPAHPNRGGAFYKRKNIGSDIHLRATLCDSV